MADDPGDGEVEDERLLELETVAAIYPELEKEYVSDEVSAVLSVAVEPINRLLIRFPAADGGPPAGLPTPPSSLESGKEPDSVYTKSVLTSDAHALAHLPPLVLRLSLPKGYPSDKPPIFHLESQSSWVPGKKLQDLEAAGLTLWEDMGRDQVVFSYIDYLREKADEGFDLAKGDGTALDVLPTLKVALLDFDLKAQRAKFERETFECGVCLEPKKGTVCHRLVQCSHVFCVPCLQDFYNSCITEGDIGSIKCMAPNCGSQSNVQPRDGKTLEPSELLQIPLEQEMVQRYIKLKRKKRLESDPTTVYCPRQWCQGPAKCPNKKPTARESNTEHASDESQDYNRTTNPNLLPPPAERLSICEDCTFAFCKVCKKSWHGEYFVCFPRAQFELTAEERASEEYMKLHTQPCPTCDARAQKTHGCNHMICFKCDTHFCYLCGAYLDKGNPYQHYNTKKSSCHMRLWELEGGDDGEFGQAFAGGAQGVPLDDDEQDEDDQGPDIPPPRPVFQPRVPDIPPRPGNFLLEPVDVRVRPAPEAERPPAVANPQNRGPGLQRFLEMVQNDEEDEWDSDEMDDEGDIGWAE